MPSPQPNRDSGEREGWQRLQGQNLLNEYAIFEWVGTVHVSMLQLNEYWEFAIRDGKVTAN